MSGRRKKKNDSTGNVIKIPCFNCGECQKSGLILMDGSGWQPSAAVKIFLTF